MTWCRTRQYRPAAHSTMMHGRDFEQPISVDKPTFVTYLVHGRTYTKEPSLPTDQVSETACQGEWIEYEEGHPLNHMVAHYDEVHLQAVDMVVEDGKTVDKEHQWSLPCPWEAGKYRAEGRMYIWNTTKPDYCQVAMVKEFLGHQLYANISNQDVPQSPQQAEAIVSSEAGEKIRIRPAGPMSQCRQVVTTTKIEDMFLFPVVEVDERGAITVDNRDRIFTHTIHPGEVDLRNYIANGDKYLYFDITSQAEKEFDTILHQDCLRRQDEARKAHFFEQGLPGYQPFLLQDGVFSLHSGETNYRYQCMTRVVHPVSTSRCYNKLPVVLRLPQHLTANNILNFSASTTYFLDPDSRLLLPISSKVPCSTLFPAVYQTHQGWISVTPDIH